QAPRFAELAPILGKLLQGALFVAHNARFDHGFLENEYGRLNQDFQPDRLCTVKLSRRLYPHFRHHNLDSLIERHQLYVAARHRALDDAKVLVNLWETLQREFAPDTFDAQVLATIERRHWPVWLPPDLPQQLPDTPGVYEMLNDRGASLYVSRALRLKSQIIAHFQPSVRASAKSQRLAAQTRHILWHETGGELGARLLEQHWVAERQPSLNRRPRRKAFTSSPWPFDGPRIIREGHWMHLIHDWDYLGSARNLDDYARLLAEGRPHFNPEVHTLLRDQLDVLQVFERGALSFLPPGRSQSETHPLGGQQAEGAASGPVLPPGRSQGEKRPLGGQQAGGAAWGPFLP
ncbi:MAG: exonuclease domain-containing protein, partial [Pigmentiphaga sp.]|nr:exonuclease domain-containing protein [Pigmentiphaga sp.]